MPSALYTITTLLTLGIVGTSQAALVDRGGGLIYDDRLNITWLQDTNYAKTSGYDPRDGGVASDGRMNWHAASEWADQLSYYDPIRNTTWSDWRLPKAAPVNAQFNYFYSCSGGTDFGWGIVSPNSELSYMWYINLGNKGYVYQSGVDVVGNPLCTEQLGWGLVDDPTNTNDESLFINLKASEYWTGTDWALRPPVAALYAHYVDFNNGLQDTTGKDVMLFAWAVRDGDVIGISPVSEPPSMALQGIAAFLCALSLIIRRSIPV